MQPNPKPAVDACVLRMIEMLKEGTAYDVKTNAGGLYQTTRQINSSLLRLYRAGKLKRSIGFRDGREVYLYEVA